MVLALRSGITKALTYHMKWSTATNTFLMTGTFLVAMVISMFTMSIWTRSSGSVDSIITKSAIAGLASNCLQCRQPFKVITTCNPIPGHQNLSLIKLKVQCHPWGPASQWQPSITDCRLFTGTTKNNPFSSVPGTLCCMYSRLWDITRSFCWRE